jgi:signal transduction histidine kinase
MTATDRDSPLSEDARRKDIRQICHDLSNPLGILRMAIYFLQNSSADAEKRTQYYAMMNESLDKIDQHMKRLRDMAASEPPSGE